MHASVQIKIHSSICFCTCVHVRVCDITRDKWVPAGSWNDSSRGVFSVSSFLRTSSTRLKEEEKHRVRKQKSSVMESQSARCHSGTVDVSVFRMLSLKLWLKNQKCDKKVVILFVKRVSFDNYYIKFLYQMTVSDSGFVNIKLTQSHIICIVLPSEHNTSQRCQLHLKQ